MPMVFAYGMQQQHKDGTWFNGSGLDDLITVIQHWGYWLWLAVMMAGQALLLVVPVAVRERRPVRRRKLLVPVITAAFLMGNVALAGVFSLATLVFGDRAFEVLDAVISPAKSAVAQVPLLTKILGPLGFAFDPGWVGVTAVAGLVLIFWMIWGLIFLRVSREDDADSITGRLRRWLLRGSILELLVAVPSHVVARHRDDCCAPAATFWGITCGLTVMLISFGPGVFFLFAGRMKHLQRAAIPPPSPPPS